MLSTVVDISEAAEAVRSFNALYGEMDQGSVALVERGTGESALWRTDRCAGGACLDSEELVGNSRRKK